MSYDCVIYGSSNALFLYDAMPMLSRHQLVYQNEILLNDLTTRITGGFSI